METSETLPFLSNKRKIKTLLPRRSTAETPAPTLTTNVETPSEPDPMQLAVAVTPFSILPENPGEYLSS